MLDALAALVGFLIVAVNKAVSRESLATCLALLTVSATTAHLAFRLGVGLNFATTLKLAAADRAHTRFYIRVKRLRRCPVRRINLCVIRRNHTADLLVHRGLGLLAVFHLALLSAVG